MFKYGDKVRHRVRKTPGVCQGESIEHTGWYTVIWDNAGPNDWPAGYCYLPDDLEMVQDLESTIT